MSYITLAQGPKAFISFVQHYNLTLMLYITLARSLKLLLVLYNALARGPEIFNINSLVHSTIDIYSTGYYNYHSMIPHARNNNANF